ncbi:50S ribosomal protein L10 [Candidatus Pacearchaeota archaeon]|nr:50S ribosomal protein L10 [Candidatus Pacearchaeota archaeon]
MKGKTEKKQNRKKEIPKKKLDSVTNIAKLIKESSSVVLVSIKNLPTSQFQLIKKKLRGKAVVIVAKKNIIKKAIDDSKKISIQDLKKYLKEDLAIMFSQENPFELSSILSRNKSMAKAKAGQEASEDITIEPGPTDLVPGPIISELSGLGLKFIIEDGKISIKDKKVIVKAKEKISEGAASIMSKLDMKPVAIGLEPLVAFDAKENKIYENIKIDSDKTLEELKQANAKALAFAVKIAYPCKETIRFILGKALSHYQALGKLIKTENIPQENTTEAK